ncbi:hypothetical protein [Maioricimonas sp. JC845]|uniref:hypothetical protein n=1 Tax=Maioricimonas sp. JC845 TaxID=3232138 RepID=UPI00345A33CF
MPAKQVREVLQWMQSVHKDVCSRFESLGTHVENERVRLLLDYIEGKEKLLAQSLKQYEEDAPDSVLATWVQFYPDEVQDRRRLLEDLEDDSTLDGVVEHCQQVDRALIKACQTIAEESDCDQVSGLFTSLARLEENMDHLYSKALLDI